jgi:hypothetical protein
LVHESVEGVVPAAISGFDYLKDVNGRTVANPDGLARPGSTAYAGPRSAINVYGGSAATSGPPDSQWVTLVVLPFPPGLRSLLELTALTAACAALEEALVPTSRRMAAGIAT